MFIAPGLGALEDGIVEPGVVWVAESLASEPKEVVEAGGVAAETVFSGAEMATADPVMSVVTISGVAIRGVIIRL